MKVLKELIKSDVSRFLTACSSTNSSSTVGIKQIVAFYSIEGNLIFIRTGQAYLSCGASVEAMFQSLPLNTRKRVSFVCVYYRTNLLPDIPYSSVAWFEPMSFGRHSILVPSLIFDSDGFLWKFKTLWELGQMQVAH